MGPGNYGRELERWMSGISTAENIIRALCSGLKSWNKEQARNTSNFSHPLQSATTQQTQIGWQNLLDWFPANKWNIICASEVKGAADAGLQHW